MLCQIFIALEYVGFSQNYIKNFIKVFILLLDRVVLVSQYVTVSIN